MSRPTPDERADDPILAALAGARELGASGRARPTGTLPPVIAASLPSRARTYLKSLAHPLEPVVQVGTQGITDGLCEAIAIALDDHELIKVRLGQSFTGDRFEAADQVAAATGARVVQVIGRIIVLYRARPRAKQEASKRPRIALPR